MAPKALKWALPSACLTVCYHFAMHGWGLIDAVGYEPLVSETTAWTMLTSVLGFLLVFRAQLSYARYWERVTLVERTCGTWLNGCSNLVAFCSSSQDKQDEVDEFQYLLSRLMSLLVSYMLRELSELEDERFPFLDLDGLDLESIASLEGNSSKINVLLQWIQRLVVESSRNGVLDIAPPILSRVFQELSLGFVHFVDTKKLSEVPFPFQFAQMVWVMLVFFSIAVVPWICAGNMIVYKAVVYTFLIVFSFWAIHHTSVEIEQPFDGDVNDLPLEDICRKFNKTLERLLEMNAQQKPLLVKRLQVPARRLTRVSTRSVVEQGANRWLPTRDFMSSVLAIGQGGTNDISCCAMRASGAADAGDDGAVSVSDDDRPVERTASISLQSEPCGSCMSCEAQRVAPVDSERSRPLVRPAATHSPADQRHAEPWRRRPVLMTSLTTTEEEPCQDEEALGGRPSSTMVEIAETSPPEAPMGRPARK